MSAPQGNLSPSRYQPNPIDDRALTHDGQAAEAYRAITAAIEEVEALTADPEMLMVTIPAKASAPLHTAESALRRAAWVLVATHGRQA